FTSKDGLNKYDGYAFTVYTHNPEDPFSLPDNFVTHTIEDNNGIFWVSTATKGLYIFDKKNEKFFPVSLIDNQKNSSNEVIWRIQIIDNILCVHRTTHVYLYDISSLIKAKDNIFTPQTLSHIICKYQLETSHQKYSYDAWLMPDKSLWICMYDSLRIFSASQSTHLYQQTLSYRTSQLSIKDSEGKYGVYDVPNPNHIMINDNGTIIIYDFANMKPIIKHTYSNDEWTRQLIVKDGSNYWLLSSDSINYHFNASTYTFTPFKNHTVFHSNRVYKACIDNSKRMWLGTTGHGILQYDFRKNLWHSFKHPHNILYTQYDTNEICCTSTDQYEPCIYNIKSRSLRKIIPSTIWKAEWDAWSFLPTGRTTFIGLLLNTNNKKKYIFSYNSSTEVFKTIQYHYSATLGYQNFIQDNSGEIWISGLNNNHSPVLIQLDKDNLALKQTYSFPAKQEYSEYPFISGYFQDNKGIFWFATMQGLFSFDTKNKKWQHFTHDPQRPTMSLPSNILFSICPDPIYPEQYIWIGTNGNGLIQFNRRTHECIYYTERNGLLNNVIYTIIPDSKNNLWLSTNRGLCCMIPLTKNPATQYRFIPFTEEDGLPDNEFNRYEGIRLSNGDLLFGGIKGKVLFTPEKVLQNHIPGNIMITN
ncbi:MAG TPA: two-component regulator propeller domain-containing protein, partial [Candidatus Kapabacteria bacterium]|nr:two-component regulator propeller domain-containing protein [Candidatus Kapabacteria bacterium]